MSAWSRCVSIFKCSWWIGIKTTKKQSFATIKQSGLVIHLYFLASNILPGIERGIHKSVPGEEESSEEEADGVADHDHQDDEEVVEELWGLVEGQTGPPVVARGGETVVPANAGQGEATVAVCVQQGQAGGDQCRHSWSVT